MKPKWTGLAVAAAAVVIGCGEGRAIFNVDVFSFMQGSGNDSLHYTVPGNASANVDNIPVQFNMLGGLGNSSVDSVTLTVGADLDNNTGTGTVSYQIFFAADSASTYLGTPFLSANGNLTPGNTTSISSSATFSDSLFNQQTIWVGIRLAANNSTATALDGDMHLTALSMRIILRDKF